MTKISKQKHIWALTAFLAVSYLSTTSFAEMEPLEAPATDASEQTPAETDSATYRTKKFVNLTVGIDEIIKLPTIPADADFRGTFKSITVIEVDRKAGLMKISPKAEGFATLTIQDKKSKRIIAEYRIDVKKTNLDKVVREIRALLSDIEGITIKVVNGRVVVDGQVLIPRDYQRVVNVIGKFGDQADSLVTISPLAMKKIAEFISRDINNPEITVRAVNEKIILEGWATDEEEQKKAEVIAKVYLPPLVIDPSVDTGKVKIPRPANDGIVNLIKIKEAGPAPPEKMVQLVVHYIELKKDYSKAFNVGWTPELSDQSNLTITQGGAGGGVVSQITGVISNLLPRLNWAKQHGHARVLESTSLIVQDGKKGEISQVTQQPYAVIGKDGVQGTAFTDVGIQSTITPIILGEKSGSIKLDMQFSISSMLGTAQNGAPITAKNQINSTVTVRDRESAAIGGLIKNSTSTGYNRNPASKNPIINLYASKEFQRDQSQFVVFITPVIKTSASSGSEALKKKFRNRE